MKNEIFTYSRLAYWQKLHGFDLLAEQREAFEQILAIAKRRASGCCCDRWRFV